MPAASVVSPHRALIATAPPVEFPAVRGPVLGWHGQRIGSGTPDRMGWTDPDPGPTRKKETARWQRPNRNARSDISFLILTWMKPLAGIF
jgi:hypothetical protein